MIDLLLLEMAGNGELKGWIVSGRGIEGERGVGSVGELGVVGVERAWIGRRDGVDRV